MAVLALALVPAAQAQGATMRVGVGAGRTAKLTQRMPAKVSALSVTINGRDATYERAASCVAYAYGPGIVARLNACHARWTLSVANASTRAATVRVSVR